MSARTGSAPEVEPPRGRGAVERLLALLLPGLVRWARGRLPARARRRLDSGDLVQEALAGALQHLPALDRTAPEKVLAYVRESIRNRIRDEIRRSGKVEVAAGGEPQAADRSPSPLELAITSEDELRFRAGLCRLDESDRALVVGRVDLGLSYEELARLSGKPTADAARVATRRAVLRLAREVGRLGSPAGEI
jgi:RNA polymerase sigma-70 factor (ECF subfamily)